MVSIADNYSLCQTKVVFQMLHQWKTYMNNQNISLKNNTV